MPIYMDRHYLPDEATAAVVAHLHQEDLKVEKQFGCRGLTYWFDDQRKTAFCLVEAANEADIRAMHNHAHGEVPNLIVEVDANVVESFLGRIEDPTNASETEINLIHDPAFRTIMLAKLSPNTLKAYQQNNVDSTIQTFVKAMSQALERFDGSLAKQHEGYYLVSFKSVSKAILCSNELQTLLCSFESKGGVSHLDLKIGLAAGSPVSEKKSFFEDAIKLADRLCYPDKRITTISNEVKDLYLGENLHPALDNKKIYALSVLDELFLNALMDFIEKEWCNAELKVDDFNKALGMSESHLYRKMISLTGKSPNNFMKEYRLNKALEQINRKMNTLSEIAFDNGFNSLSYFSKCFQKRFELLPSEYLQNRV